METIGCIDLSQASDEKEIIKSGPGVGIVLRRKIVHLLQNNLAASAVALSKKIRVVAHKSESVLSMLTVVLQKTSYYFRSIFMIRTLDFSKFFLLN